jgi:N-acetylglucosaminyldiphosphoundecaprenol N-acetyl-beta-D-mannosaminyltransferase
VNLLGVGISAIDMPFALTQIDSWIESDSREYISVCTVHTIMECQNSAAMRLAVNQAGMATPDVMPLVWLANMESEREVGRVYGPDLMLEVCARSVERGYKHYFYGGAEGVPQQLSESLANRFPGLSVAGGYSPPFRGLKPLEEITNVDQINDADPDIVWVGLGTPKQDLWMAKHRPQLNAAVLIAVGAAFDFHTDRIAQAPHWMQRNGLEWFYRLAKEPKRLWYRYLVLNPLFVLRVTSQKAGFQKYAL